LTLIFKTLSSSVSRRAMDCAAGFMDSQPKVAFANPRVDGRACFATALAARDRSKPLNVV
jgi:hypothetical protein